MGGGRKVNKNRKIEMKLGKPLFLNMCPKALLILLNDIINFNKVKIEYLEAMTIYTIKLDLIE